MFSQTLLSQIEYTSLNNHTGNWESPSTWVPAWIEPKTNINSIDVSIYGYVTRTGSLSFTGTEDYLIINDTLVIYGDLTIKNNSKLILKENAILIVRGNLTLANNADIFSHSYLVVTGDFIKEGSLNNGNLYTETPSDIFIGGNVEEGLNEVRYPALQCPGNNPYVHSGCSYGDMVDLANSPVNSFFQNTCGPVTITSNGSPLCQNGSRMLTGSPTGGTFYLISGPGSISTNLLSATGAGTIVIKYSETGCQNSGTQNITVNPLPTPIINISDNSGTTINDGIICNGQTTTLTASGGTSFSWSSGETTSEITKSNAGTYTVTATDANNCQNTSSSTITVNALPAVSISIAETSGILNNDGIICNGASTNLTASGGTIYSWSSGETLSVITKSIAGTYSVTATDGNNCQNTSSSTITVSALPTVSISVDEVSGILNNDGIICYGESTTLTASGGTSYSWSSGETLSVITKSNAGTYTVTAMDANNCQNSSSSTITVSALPTVTISVDEVSGILNNDGIICNGESTTLTVSGGTSYSWSSGETLSVITKSIAGIYTVTATDANNCQNTSSSTITVNALPTASISVDEVSGILNNDGKICNGESATLTASGGKSYSWSSGETLSVITKSNAGTYTVTATDGNNCQNSSSSTITVNALPTVSISVDEVSGILNNDGIICNGESATLTSSGGTSYSWSSGETLSVITKSNAGTYTVTATDANNCQNTSSSTITVNTLPTVGISIAETSGILNNDGIICSGASTTLTAMGGVSYSWSSGETTSEIIKTNAGIYTVIATDGNNCQNTSSSTITVNSLPTVSISISETSGILPNDGIICNGASTILSATGGVSYIWSTGETLSEITKSIAGTYTVSVIDGNNCQNTESKIITVNPLPIVDISISETSGILNNDGIICSGAPTTLSATGGVSYNWSSGETTSEITKSNAGTYTVTVADENNCQNITSKTIIENPLPIAHISITETSGILNNDGIICDGETATLSATGGISCIWSSGETSAEIQVNKSSNYSVTVTDINQCLNTSSVDIIITKTIAEAGIDTDICGKQYSLQAIAGSGTGTWTVNEGVGFLTFSPNENDPESTIITNKYGNYKLTWSVVNENCTASSDVNIIFHEPPIANAGSDQDLNYAFSTKLNAELPSGLMGQWTTLSGSGSIYNIQSPNTTVSNLSAGDNSFLWTVNSDKCSDTDTILVNVNNLFVPNVITPDGDNKNNFFVIKDIEKNSPVELIIFNRWGNEVYKNTNYNNTWDGRNNNNDVLPDDTYFYILKFASGKIIKSFVVIKK